MSMIASFICYRKKSDEFSRRQGKVKCLVDCLVDSRRQGQGILRAIQSGCGKVDDDDQMIHQQISPG